MLARALILLLVVLNLGVAIWWASRDAPPPPVESETGIATLRLLKEPATPAAPGAPPIPRSASTAVDGAGPVKCLRFGDPSRARDPAAVASLAIPGSDRLEAYVSVPPPQDWRVLIRPYATLELARAQAERIRAAGFQDLLVVADGPEAGSIALGRYGNREAAERHRATLAAARIAAEVLPVGGPTTFMTLQVPASTDLAAARAQLGALDAVEVACQIAR